KSLQLYRASDNKREAATILLNLAAIEQRESNYDPALDLFRQSFDMAKAEGTIDAKKAAGEGIGAVLTAKKDFSGALSALRESLNAAKEVKDTTRQTEVTWRLAQTRFAMEDSSDAAADAQAAVALAQSSRSPKLIYLTTTTLGQIYAAQNRTELAIETLK